MSAESDRLDRVPEAFSVGPPVNEAESSLSTTANSRGLSLSTLVQEEGTVPFKGFTPADADSISYPDGMLTVGNRFDEHARSFLEVLNVLPQPMDGALLSINPFAITDEHGTVVDLDREALKDIHGLDVDDIEDLSGESFDTLCETAIQNHAEAHYSVESHKEIIDPRRLALRTLFGIDCRYRYYVGSNQYEAGDMLRLLKQKQQVDHDDVFGWLRFRSYGGETTITTIYPSLSTEDVLADLPDDIDLNLDENTLVAASSDDSNTSSEPKLISVETPADSDDSLEDDPDLTAYFGEQLTYDYHGTRKISATPVLFLPSKGTVFTLPVDTSEFSFSRKHAGDWMNSTHERENERLPPADWHNAILDELEDLTESVSKDLLRSRMVTLDFSALPYSVSDFFSYLGVPDTYAETAADRIERLADNGGELTFSLWTLQVGLKLTLLEDFQGDKASGRFRELEAIAGQLLRYPVQQISVANDAYCREAEADEEDDEEESVLDPAQQTLFDSLDELEELPGVATDDLDLTDAQKLQSKIQATFDDVDEA